MQKRSARYWILFFLATGFSGKRTDLVYGTVHVLKYKFFFFIEST